MSPNPRKIRLSPIVVLFVSGLTLGLLCATVGYAGAFLMVMGFAMAPVVVYCLDVGRKFAGVLAMDAGIIIGASGRSAYWRSMHEFEALVEWKAIVTAAILALCISIAMGAVLFVIARIWPIRTDTSSGQSKTDN